MVTLSLERLRDPSTGASYPRGLLEGCKTALVLCAAGFHGRQDAVWIAEAGLTATCVDLDDQRLREMAAVYPGNWEFVTADVFAYASTTDRQWDVVSIDCPTNLFNACAAALDLWTELATKAVVLGCGPDPDLTVPAGWRQTDMRHRSNFRGGVYWAVLEPA